MIVEQLSSQLGETRANELQLEANKYFGYLRSRPWWKPGLDWVANEGGVTVVKDNLCLSGLLFNPNWHDGFRDYTKQLVSLYANRAYDDWGINEISFQDIAWNGNSEETRTLSSFVDESSSSSLGESFINEYSQKPLYDALVDGFTEPEVDCLMLWAKTKSPTEVAQVLDWPVFVVRSVIKRAYAKGQRLVNKGVASPTIG